VRCWKAGISGRLYQGFLDLTDGETVPQTDPNLVLELDGSAQRNQNAQRHHASLFPFEAWTGPDASEHETGRYGHHRR
jgi:hypothetical protein